MEILTKDDFEILHQCPWDNASSDIAEFLYQDDMGCDIVRCPQCGIVYAKRRLNESGLPKYWGDYLSRVHVLDPEAVVKRNKMYEIDYAFSHQYVSSGRVLDVGCGNGSFMGVYERHGYDVYGVEYGKEAADTAGKTHSVRYGVFDEMNFGDERYDLIIFRGVLQYVPYPTQYLEKAISLLARGGHLFITAQPNMNSFAFCLFEKHFTQPVTGADFIGYTEPALSSYLQSFGLLKVGEKFFYEETPYADVEEDILKMAKGVQYKRAGKEIDFKAPAYWGNMMTLMYHKNM
ncbi:class I SAM-dependent methyltransferase [uncultured Selenomonas sp.]|uniref:class I SAM-dependent methyltransferase n=1 Tax=uncultured Selenomonas sp. TaxID=159275 RepID=UPI0028E325FA|nr:class I SAM-dependent methyltransferase [uncultured Selenomonas sp.]